MNRIDTDRIWQDLHLVADDVERLLQDTTDTVGEEANELRARARRRLADARTRLRELQHEAVHKAQETSDRIDSYAHRQPWVVAGSAAAMAFLLGMLSRRSHH